MLKNTTVAIYQPLMPEGFLSSTKNYFNIPAFPHLQEQHFYADRQAKIQESPLKGVPIAIGIRVFLAKEKSKKMAIPHVREQHLSINQLKIKYLQNEQFIIFLEFRQSRICGTTPVPCSLLPVLAVSGAACAAIGGRGI